MIGPPARESFLRKMESDVQPPVEPATVTGVGATSVSVVVGHMGGMATIIDYMGPDDLAVGDYVQVRRIPRDPFGRYELIGRRSVASPLGASTAVVNDPVTGTPIPPTSATPIRMTSIPPSLIARIVALEARTAGHVIVGPDGTIYTARAKLKFAGDVLTVEDDSGGNQTIVTVLSSTGSTLNYNAADIGYNDMESYNG